MRGLTCIESCLLSLLLVNPDSLFRSYEKKRAQLTSLSFFLFDYSILGGIKRKLKDFSFCFELYIYTCVYIGKRKYILCCFNILSFSQSFAHILILLTYIYQYSIHCQTFAINQKKLLKTRKYISLIS